MPKNLPKYSLLIVNHVFKSICLFPNVRNDWLWMNNAKKTKQLLCTCLTWHFPCKLCFMETMLLSYKQSSRTTESLSHALRPLKQTTTNFQVKLSLDPEMCFYDLKAEKSSKLKKKYQPKNQQATQGFPCKCFIYITPSLDFPHVWSEALTGRSADAISPLKAH